MLSSANLVGYIKCSSSAKEKMEGLVKRGLHDSASFTESFANNSTIQGWLFRYLLGTKVKTNENIV